MDPPEEAPWEDEITCIMLEDITNQRDNLWVNVQEISEHSPASRSMCMMLEVVDNLLKVYRSIGPLSSL